MEKKSVGYDVATNPTTGARIGSLVMTAESSKVSIMSRTPVMRSVVLFATNKRFVVIVVTKATAKAI